MSPDKPRKSRLARSVRTGVLGLLTAIGLIWMGVLIMRLAGPLHAMQLGKLRWVGPVGLLCLAGALFWVWHHWDAIIRGFHFKAEQERIWLAARHRLAGWALGYCALVAVFLVLR